MGHISGNQYNSIRKQDLTFKLNGEINETNTALTLTPVEREAITQDLSTLETQEQSANNIAFLWKLISELACQIYNRVTELTYEVVCHAQSLPTDEGFAVPTGTATKIPFNTVRYRPTDGSFLEGEFTAGRSGYYDVDVYYTDTITTPITRVWLGIAGGSDASDNDSLTINADYFQLQASRKIYCPKGGNIHAYLRHAYGFNITFNDRGADKHGDGFISISWAGSKKSATNI